MKKFKILSFILCLAIFACLLYLGGNKLNTKIQETITRNFQTEIDALKQKIDKQGELINSIINIKDKEDEIKEDENTNTNASTNAKEEFSYIIENGGITITKYNGSKTSVQIPNKIDQMPVLKIGKHAFEDTKVKSVTLPSSCTEVDWFAFYGCFALTTVYISKDVTTIGYGAFDACSKSLTIYCEKNSYAEKYAQSFGISYSDFQ